MNVLVVDDNELHLKMCRVLLNNLGHQAVTVNSLENLKEQVVSIAMPNVVLIDHRLGSGETGLDILKYLKGASAWAGTRYIVLVADEDERAQVEGTGFDQVAFKPITEAILKELIN